MKYFIKIVGAKEPREFTKEDYMKAALCHFFWKDYETLERILLNSKKETPAVSDSRMFWVEESE